MTQHKAPFHTVDGHARKAAQEAAYKQQMAARTAAAPQQYSFIVEGLSTPYGVLGPLQKKNEKEQYLIQLLPNASTDTIRFTGERTIVVIEGYGHIDYGQMGHSIAKGDAIHLNDDQYRLHTTDATLSVLVISKKGTEATVYTIANTEKASTHQTPTPRTPKVVGGLTAEQALTQRHNEDMHLQTAQNRANRVIRGDESFEITEAQPGYNPMPLRFE